MNQGYAYRSRPSPDEAGRTLLEYLTTRYAHSSRATWTARLAAGELTLDERTATGDEVLRPGQRVVWHRPPWREPDVPMHYAVAHDDESLLVVDKPAGLPTMPAGGFLEHTLLYLVRRDRGHVSPVHRLGRFTSGLVVCARTRQAAAILARTWHTGAVVKSYRALMSGVPTWESMHITTPIGPVAHARLGTVHAAGPNGAYASSRVQVVGRRAHATLVDVDLDTGRPHQIRIHLAAVGHPLVGDPLYAPGGGVRRATSALPGDGGYWLHAHRLTIPSPLDGRALAFESTPPTVLRA